MYSKSQQTSSNRLKSKPKKNKKFLSWLHNQNDIFCFACGQQNGLECHHIKLSSSDVKNDEQILMLCGESCHRNGTELSAHSTPVKFRKVFPIVTQLQFAEILYNRYQDEK